MRGSSRRAGAGHRSARRGDSELARFDDRRRASSSCATSAALVEETAEASASPPSRHREWKTDKAWLLRELAVKFSGSVLSFQFAMGLGGIAVYQDWWCGRKSIELWGVYKVCEAPESGCTDCDQMKRAAVSVPPTSTKGRGDSTRKSFFISFPSQRLLPSWTERIIASDTLHTPERAPNPEDAS